MIYNLRGGHKALDPRLGWLPQKDPKSRSYKAILKLDEPKNKYYNCRLWLDQLAEGSCVGCAFTHFLATTKAISEWKTLDLNYAKTKVYWPAQQLDDWQGGCVDLETKCLSNKGWVGPEDLSIGDSILGFDIETETLKWTEVQMVHQYKMPYRIWYNESFNAAVTDNHRWVVRNRIKRGPYKFVTTDNWKSQHEFPRAAACSDLPSESKWSDDFVELVAWFITEGHIKHGNRHKNTVEIYQKKYFLRVKQLMERFGINNYGMDKIGCATWSISYDLGRQLKEIAPDKVPTLDWLCSLTLKQLKLFLEVCTLADGSTEIAKGQRQERNVITQKVGPILDAMLIAAVLSGQPISRKSKNGGSLKNCETWTLRKSSGNIEIRNLSSTPYLVGDVWCPQSQLGTFVARRGSSIFITGNSYSGASPHYEGTSILAGAKAVQNLGLISEYRWAFGEQELASSVSHVGPAVIGIKWYEGMRQTDSNGFVKPSGTLLGGHAILVYGINANKGYYRLRNSWGQDWGIKGNCKITREDMATLLSQEGEACIPLKNS